MSFLSQVQGRPVFDADGAQVGQLRDLVINTDVPYPPIHSLVVNHHGTLRSIPWSDVASVTPSGTALLGKFKEGYLAPPDDLIWLARDVLDKQIVDTSGVKLVRVNDVALTPLNHELRVAGVDNSTAGLLRRVGLERAAGLFGKRRPRLIDWEQVDIGPALDEVRLKVPFDRLQRMRPADIADIVSQMSPGEAADVMEALDEETAARAMAELPDRHQAAVLAAMEPEEAADVLEEMEPDEAADVLGDVDEQTAEELMRLMAPEAAEEVRSLLAYPEDTAGGLMNSAIISVGHHATLGEAVDLLREMDPFDEVHVLFAVDDNGRLRGCLSLRDLLLASPSARVADIMRGDVETVLVDDPDEEVAQKLVRYDLLAIPVVDSEGHLKGAVTVNDVLDLVTPRSWHRRARRMMG